MSNPFSYPQSVQQLVENHMRQWELNRNQSDPDPLAQKETSGIDYITLSRELGSGGEAVARILAEKLDWQVYDKEILNYMTENLQIQEQVLAEMDEHVRGAMEEWLNSLPSSNQQIGQYAYFQHLTRALFVIARHGRAIIVGRGAGFVLPRENGLSIRVTAPSAVRVKSIATLEKLSSGQARKRIEKADKEQERFVREYTHRDFNDCSCYDLVVNTEKLPPESVAKLIWRALDQRVACPG